MSVATSQDHKEHAIVGSVAKHLTLCHKQQRKHPEILVKIVENVYQDLINRTGVQKRTRRGSKRRCLARQECNNLEKAELLRSQ